MTKEDKREQLLFAKTGKSEKISEHTTQLLVSFLLTFNLFEDWLFEKERGWNARMRISEKLVEAPWFNLEHYKEFAEFFSKRYITTENAVNSHFRNLQLSKRANDGNKSEYEIVKSVLLGEKNSAKDTIYAYFCIAYRFRNNLFHGNKQVLGLNIYDECFQVVIDFMCQIMDEMITNDFSLLNLGKDEKISNT